jgi:hypothetical protein
VQKQVKKAVPGDFLVKRSSILDNCCVKLVKGQKRNRYRQHKRVQKIIQIKTEELEMRKKSDLTLGWPDG